MVKLHKLSCELCKFGDSPSRPGCGPCVLSGWKVKKGFRAGRPKLNGASHVHVCDDREPLSQMVQIHMNRLGDFKPDVVVRVK
jgi:hypothetical protein